MTIFIDDFQLVNNGQLVWLDMTSIDYININLSGTGEGIQGGGGTIRIYTDPFKRRKRNKNRAFEYKFPVTFSKDKKFYTPIYQNYESVFFQKYGVIDWLPINKINSEGGVTILFPTFQSEKVKLFIEGTTSNGDFIVEEKIITID
ncbi:MAG: hypothetical protein HC798_01545 [Polaribacter sp.]|nr:hypothetical protein [Polaribacter sp.]